MLPLTAVPASSAPPEEMNAILADYLALDRARVFRRLCVVRFGLMAAAAAIVGVAVPGLPAFARWFAPTVCLAPPMAVWIREWRLTRQLARRLDALPVRKS